MPRIIKESDRVRVAFWHEGRQHRRQFSFKRYGTEQAAIDAAKQYIASTVGWLEMPDDYQLDDQIVDYLRAIDHRKKYSTIRSEQYRLRIFSEWAQTSSKIRSVTHITLADIRRFQEYILRGGHQYKDRRRRRPGNRIQTWRNYQYGLSAFLWWAVDTGLIDSNPIAGARELRVRESGAIAGRAISTDEVEVVMAAYDDPFIKAMFGLLLYTGCRIGEAIALTWRNLNIKNRTVKFVATKTHQDRIVPINEKLLALLEVLPKRRLDDCVISKPNGQPYYQHNWWFRLLNKALENAGYPPARIHDLRVTFVTNLINNGANPHAVSKLVGHSTMRVTERYTRVSDRSKSDALDHLDY